MTAWVSPLVKVSFTNYYFTFIKKIQNNSKFRRFLIWTFSIFFQDIFYRMKKSLIFFNILYCIVCPDNQGFRYILISGADTIQELKIWGGGGGAIKLTDQRGAAHHYASVIFFLIQYFFPKKTGGSAPGTAGWACIHLWIFQSSKA